METNSTNGWAYRCGNWFLSDRRRIVIALLALVVLYWTRCSGEQTVSQTSKSPAEDTATHPVLNKVDLGSVKENATRQRGVDLLEELDFLKKKMIGVVDDLSIASDLKNEILDLNYKIRSSLRNKGFSEHGNMQSLTPAQHESIRQEMVVLVELRRRILEWNKFRDTLLVAKLQNMLAYDSALSAAEDYYGKGDVKLAPYQRIEVEVEVDCELNRSFLRTLAVIPEEAKERWNLFSTGNRTNYKRYWVGD